MRLALTGATIISSISPPSVATADILVEQPRGAVGVPVPDGIARLDCSGCLVVPGNVCAHTHLYSALARGMPGAGPAPRSFIEILRRVWWRLDRAPMTKRSAPPRSSAGSRRCGRERRP